MASFRFRLLLYSCSTLFIYIAQHSIMYFLDQDQNLYYLVIMHENSCFHYDKIIVSLSPVCHLWPEGIKDNHLMTIHLAFSQSLLSTEFFFTLIGHITFVLSFGTVNASMLDLEAFYYAVGRCVSLSLFSLFFISLLLGGGSRTCLGW